MECGVSKLSWLAVISCCFSLTAAGQQALNSPPSAPKIPSDFKLDMQTAARLRPQLVEQSVAAAGRYAVGRQVFDRLIAKVAESSGVRLEWELRIVEDGQLNAYSSPDGTVYVESGLAQTAGTSAGLWAAILSHEIAHVQRRDWARRYLFQKSLENGSSASIVLGDPGTAFSSWTNAGKASEEMAEFCRRMEVEADREGLMLMAQAGYHPDFVPALHHLLHAQGAEATAAEHAMHPCWEERDRELKPAYMEASIVFEHLWPAWYASPGGNPPVVVFADEPKVRKTASREVEIQIPMSCQNLAGTVEVVLLADHSKTSRSPELPGQVKYGEEIRQLTGCTSPKTTITFTLAEASGHGLGAEWTDVYVLDQSGAVLTRADVPKSRH